MSVWHILRRWWRDRDCCPCHATGMRDNCGMCKAVCTRADVRAYTDAADAAHAVRNALHWLIGVGRPDEDEARTLAQGLDAVDELESALATTERQRDEAREALRRLNNWAAGMPDAGLTRGDPRYDWWWEGYERRQAALAVLAGKATARLPTRADTEGDRMKRRRSGR